MFLLAAKSPSVSQRQAEIIEVVLRNGWNYFRSRIVKDAEPEQPSLPLPKVLRQILIELGPTFVKLGQLLSTRPDLLSPEYIAVLETLQNNVPALPWSEIEPILETAFGQSLKDAFLIIEPVAIAAGSLAQVHRATLKNGEMVAIKVQRPGIREIVERDLEVLESLANWFSRDKFGQAYDLPGLVEEFRYSLLGELDFRREARNTEKLRQNLENSRLWQRGQVVIPKVYSQWTTDKVLTLEWIEGIKLNQVNLPESRKKQLAALAVQVVMQQIYLDRFFHADPHPGNFLYIGEETQDRLALLDCGMVALLDPRTQSILTDLLVGIVYERPKIVAQAIRELGFTRLEVDLRAIESAFDRLLRRFYTRPLEEINLAELLNEALRIPRENNIQMPGTIGLFVKTIANIEGIARQLDPLFPFVEVARPIVERAIRQRLLGAELLQDATQSSLYLSRLTTQFPQRFEILLDRLERSELGINLGWRMEREFLQAQQQGMNRLSLAILAMGALIAGAILQQTVLVASSSPELIGIVSQGLLVAGVGLMGWVAIALLRKS
ncbi:ABC1 kinase family protein [Fischerella sp. PCC 9605]|uniref:ABC1 kinase family protein n=1 Tax=Fischerella sp. PCC 9605 TaxID=1173024 RepID=UPI00047ADC03|nr:AarF/ABC1/UbiB kinase family protein [Fischerella sp. PCC 9605]